MKLIKAARNFTTYSVPDSYTSEYSLCYCRITNLLDIGASDKNNCWYFACCLGRAVSERINETENLIF